MKQILGAIHDLAGSLGRPVKLMEVCGTHTVAIFRHGIRDLLPENIGLLSGPGCPVCVTSIRDVDTVIEIARQKDVIVTTFGDMMRVPGNTISLMNAKAEGADIRIVYSPLDALKLAEDNPDRKVVFFAAGFETTSPLIAGTLAQAEMKKTGNFFIFSVHKVVPPALKALLDAPEVRIDGLILPGHVSAIIGLKPYSFLSETYHKPSVVTGFSAGDILTGIFMLLRQMATGRAAVENQYVKVVREEGNPRATSLLYEFFEPDDAYWRGIGVIPGSGLKLKDQFRGRDIANIFSLDVPEGQEPGACSCGDVLKGIKIPIDCGLFGKACTPDKPVGACMVSSEGSCAAYYKYAGLPR
jgi:hydrogenase expression/formation protein HypD